MKAKLFVLFFSIMAGLILGWNNWGLCLVLTVSIYVLVSGLLHDNSKK